MITFGLIGDLGFPEIPFVVRSPTPYRQPPSASSHKSQKIPVLAAGASVEHTLSLSVQSVSRGSVCLQATISSSDLHQHIPTDGTSPAPLLVHVLPHEVTILTCCFSGYPTYHTITCLPYAIPLHEFFTPIHYIPSLFYHVWARYFLSHSSVVYVLS